jgi:benzylsuccinate CoA-transferase BbsE subunit
MDSGGTPGALAGVRLLDLSSPLANFAARLVAGLGADVIKVEPPGGDPLRQREPFWGGQPDPDGSLDFIVNNVNKRGVTLDLECAAGQALFRRLAKDADIVLETAPPGWMAGRGVGFDALSALNPRLVYVAVTPFGQTGPRTHWQAGEFTLQAIGGALYLTGEPGERPLRGGGGVAEKMTGYIAATAMVFALNARVVHGRGQFIDVSAQEAVASQMESSQVGYWFSGNIRRRGGWRYPSTTCPAGIYPCKDGHASIVASKPHQWSALRDWIGDQRLYEERYMVEATRFAERDFIDPIVIDWTRTMAKAELFHGGQARGIPIGESMTPADLVRDEHLRERGYVVPAHHPRLGDFEVPGASFIMSETPWALRHPAPLLGEHNAEVYAEAGIGPAELEQLSVRGVI